MNWLLLSTIGCSLFVLFTSSGTEKSSIRKTLLGIFLFPSASFCLMLKNQDRLLSLLEGAIPCGFYDFVSHFSYDKGRKQSTQSRHCSTEKIYRSWEFCPDEKQTKEDKTCAYQQPFYQCCFHLDFLRGLNRYLSLQTKFYSYPRRPLFLGALGKARALLAPRACLKTMLLQAFTSRFIAWSQYLCIAKFSSHLFRTRSGRIGQRRCFLFRWSVGNKRMSGGLCDVSM